MRECVRQWQSDHVLIDGHPVCNLLQLVDRIADVFGLVAVRELFELSGWFGQVWKASGPACSF